MSETLQLRVNVQGHAVEVEADPHRLLWNVMNQAFALTDNTGQPYENWEMRDSDGRLLDIEAEVRDFGWTPGTTLHLNMKAAIGG